MSDDQQTHRVTKDGGWRGGVVFDSSTIFINIHSERHAGAEDGTCMPPRSIKAPGTEGVYGGAGYGGVMDPRRIYIVSWLCKPNGIELPYSQVAGAIVCAHLVADDLEDALNKSNNLVVESGWLPDSIPASFSLYFENEIDDIEFDETRDQIRSTIEDGPWCLNHCYEKDDPLYNKECSNYIWLLDWVADNESDNEVVDIEDASAHMAVFLKCDGLLEVVNESYEWIRSMGWNPDDEPRWAEQLAYSDIDDRVHPQYQIAALEAFRDGHSVYIQSFPRAEGYPERIFPLCEPDQDE